MTHKTQYFFCFSQGCGGEVKLNVQSGSIFSPEFPESYQPNLDCTWTVQVQYPSLVSLTFNEFELEDSVGCISDYVIVRDGHSQTSPVLGKYCGTNVPVYIISTNNKLMVTLHTNQYHEAKGFEISWMAYNRPLSGPSLPNGKISSFKYLKDLALAFTFSTLLYSSYIKSCLVCWQLTG